MKWSHQSTLMSHYLKLKINFVYTPFISETLFPHSSQCGTNTWRNHSYQCHRNPSSLECYSWQYSRCHGGHLPSQILATSTSKTPEAPKYWSGHHHWNKSDWLSHFRVGPWIFICCICGRWKQGRSGKLQSRGGYWMWVFKIDISFALLYIGKKCINHCMFLVSVYLAQVFRSTWVS